MSVYCSLQLRDALVAAIGNDLSRYQVRFILQAVLEGAVTATLIRTKDAPPYYTSRVATNSEAKDALESERGFIAPGQFVVFEESKSV